ncbi:calcineurin-like phosphoesterase C-terminal domain-containing protein [Lysobacter humi (ex Lee et al. 2017)]
MPAVRHAIASLLVVLLGVAGPARAAVCEPVVFEDRDGDGRRDAREPGVPGVRVSDGLRIAITGRDGRYALPPTPGRPLFVIKPAGYRVGTRDDGLPAHWQPVPDPQAPALRYGGLPRDGAHCGAFALRREPARRRPLDVLVFADPQTATLTDVGHYARDVVDPLVAAHGGARAADVGLTLGDVANDDLALYPALNAVTRRLRTPWLHAAGNHDLDFDAPDDAHSLDTFRRHFGPDTFAWEEPEAVFVVLDDVIYRPEQRPAYVGGLREDQFTFLEAYLPTLDPRRLLVLALHIPLFDEDGRETFRHADRERLFRLLERFPKRLVLSGHGHVQRHVFHDRARGWRAEAPLHEFNVGAVCGAFWSGVRDAQGIPDATMADGTPNGHARMRVDARGDYALSWHPARLGDGGPSATSAMALHAPRVLRRGAYPAWGVYANVFMAHTGSRVEYRVDGGDWRPMPRVERPDPRLLAENVRDDEAARPRGYDRSPEAQPSTHLFRGALPTDLAAGTHRVDVRHLDPWQGEQRASIDYRLDEVAP